MRLLAISDLHVGHEKNRELLATVSDHKEDWLIVAGDAMKHMRIRISKSALSIRPVQIDRFVMIAQFGHF